MIPLLLTFLQVLIVLACAPFVVGLIRWFKARLQGRHGAAPWLVYYALAVLFKKENIISSSRSWVFRAVPFVVCGLAIFLVATLPLLFSSGRMVSIDFILFAGILALGSVFLVLGGLDSASAFGGMGSSREMTLAALVEPAVITVFASFAVVAGTGQLDGMVTQSSLVSSPGLILSAVALVLIALAENARYPVDNPATHLELTMVHEAMILEYSGVYLALLEYASYLKLTVFLLLIGQLVLPVFANPLLAVLSSLGVLVVGTFSVALLESSMAKMRFYRMQEFMTSAYVLALGGLILTLLI